MTADPRHPLVALALAASLLLAPAGCSDDDSREDARAGTDTGSGGDEAAVCETPPEDDAASVDVTMSESAIEADADAAAGEVVFTVRNDGSATHQLAIYRGASDAIDPRNLDEADLVTEFETLPAGASCNRTVTLEAGDYTLVCLVPGHAGSGMVSGLTVA